MDAFSRFFSDVNLIHIKKDAKYYEDGVQYALELFSLEITPDIIYTHSDDHAAGIIHGASTLGFKHGGNFQIIGEDNLSSSKILNFSSIQLNLNRVGAEGVKSLINHDSNQIAVEANLINRSLSFPSNA